MVALSMLHDAGVHVILRLWPFIPDLAGNLEFLLMAAQDAGVQTVQYNFLKLLNAGRDVKRFRDALDYNLPDGSCMAWEQRGNFKIASLDDQRREISALEDICHGLGPRVVSCDDLTGSRNWQDCCGEEILMELAKLRGVKVGEKWRLTEITKKQRTIFEKMEIGIPVEASMVIKKGGV